jgi:hypothetical protein
MVSSTKLYMKWKFLLFAWHVMFQYASGALSEIVTTQQRWIE